MPTRSPFHERTAPLCTSYQWKEWAGYYAVRAFDTCHEPEYMALRHAVGMIDVTALYKYEVVGPDAAKFLSAVMVKNLEKLRVGRVTYLCWCDDDGKVLDDGTVTRIDDLHYRVTAAEPSYRWLANLTRGFRATVEDVSETLAALALQGPNSRAVLDEATDGAIGGLRFFAHCRATIAGAPVDVTRTGYTGDLGYEIWIKPQDAIRVWDALLECGRNYRILPAGLDALDVARIEAGFIMNGVDYFSSNHCLIESRKSTPLELGLGWAVNLDRDPFVGQQALAAEAERGPAYSLVTLDYDWSHFEDLYAARGLPPQTPAGAWRTSTPVYDGKRFIGNVTSGTWSPTLKKLIGLASLESTHAAIGTEVEVEVTVEYKRKHVRATVVEAPLFDPARKRS